MERKSGYNSNLASEFYVLSCLHRLGRDAALTLGNKKSVDITVICEEGDAITIDVKASVAPTDWPLGKAKSPKHPDRHFLALISYEGSFDDVAKLPRVWIIPFAKAEPFLRIYKGEMTVVSRSAVNKSGALFENAWSLLVAPAV